MYSGERTLSANWPAAAGCVKLGAGDVHIYSTLLTGSAEQVVANASLLEPGEVDRANRFHFEEDRSRFIVGRGFVRRVLARYLHVAPGTTRFAFGMYGKPVLKNPWSRSGIQFNLAHSGELALLALTKLGDVGVDVEVVRPVPEADDLVQSFFSPRERIVYARLPAGERSAAFFHLWTRKEAWLKATGEGIARSLNQVEVSFLPDEEVRLYRVPRPYGPLGRWHLAALAPAGGAVGAICVKAQSARFRCWHWNAEVLWEDVI